MKNAKIRLVVATVIFCICIILVYALPHIWKFPDAVGTFLFFFALFSLVDIVFESVGMLRLKLSEKKNSKYKKDNQTE